MSVDLGSLAPWIILECIVVFVSVAYLGPFIVFIYDKISKLAIYHEPKTRNCDSGEPFFHKIIKVFWYYLCLTPFVFLSIYISLKFIQIISTSSLDQIKNQNTSLALLTPTIALIFLFLMRWLMNPTYSKLHSFLKIRSKSPVNKDTEKMAEIFKERVHSLFSSYICMTLIISLFFITATIATSVIARDLSFFSNTMTSLFSTSLTGDMVIESLILFIISLAILTIIIEVILLTEFPIIRVQWVCEERNKPFYNLNREFIPTVYKIPSKMISLIKVKLGNKNRRNGNS